MPLLVNPASEFGTRNSTPFAVVPPGFAHPSIELLIGLPQIAMCLLLHVH